MGCEIVDADSVQTSWKIVIQIISIVPAAFPSANISLDLYSIIFEVGTSPVSSFWSKKYSRFHWIL